ncbi:hypothetical protein FFLO_05742 [Filobasidium floriforme]|uniref:Transcription factor domain-containing protein n=1 Tax=Filobasidium floriforme TaxID=5210 RepID=A0A8K0JIJ9_9TREE|nr:hypothetical protein FFLO_05742 [Filobasidium floriforme]
MLERQLEAMKMQGISSPQELGEGRPNHHQVHNSTKPTDPIPSQGLFTFLPSTSTDKSPGYSLGGVQPGVGSPAHISPNQNQLYDQVQSYFPPLAPASTEQKPVEKLNQPQMVHETIQPFAYVPEANVPPPQSTANLQYPRYRYPITAVQAQNQTQDSRDVFLQPTGQTVPKPDIWALNSVKPASSGLNWFQARDFVQGQVDGTRLKYDRHDLNQQVKATGYAATLPPVEILHLLVRRYFNKGNYMAKIMDQGRFWQRLSLPPNHPDYPYLGTLHAICAAASHLTASTGIKRQPPRPLNQAELSNVVTETEVYNPYDTGSLAFRDHHARLATAILQVSLAHTHPLYSVLEASIVLQYHWMHEAFLAKAWITPGITNSLSAYLALNERRPPERAAKMTAVEMRDADMVFWIGFCNEKMACAMSSWPSSYREEDITAYLPTCAGPHGEYLHPTQWMGSPDLYTHHPVQHCDSTIFFIKSQVLLSRVHTLIRDSKKAQLQGLGVSAQAFQQQRIDIDSFLLNIPRYWKSLFKQDGVDFDMLLCLFSTHLATIQMAELIPLVDPPLPPMYKVGATDAALSVLALAESLIGTSLDLRVLPMFVPCVMFHSSRVLVGELQQALLRADQIAASRFDAGLTSIGLAMDIFGEEFSQMFSIVDGVREQALADSRMTDFAKSYEKVVTGEAKGGGVVERPEIPPPGPMVHVPRY